MPEFARVVIGRGEAPAGALVVDPAQVWFISRDERLVGGAAVQARKGRPRGGCTARGRRSRGGAAVWRRTMNRTTDVIVIGGGAVGLSIALELAKRRVGVTVLDRGALAGEASTRNGG